MNREVYMTGKKMSVYLKKYWWIILTCFLGGIFVFFIGVQKNDNAENLINETYEQIFLPVILDEEKEVNLSSADENASVLLKTKEIQEKINKQLINDKKAEILDWNSVSINAIENSSYINVKINNNKMAKYQVEIIVKTINEKFGELDQNMKLNPVDDGKTNILIVEDSSNIFLKDILAMGIFVFIGFVIVYVLALFGNRVAEPKDIEWLLEKKPEVCVEKKKRFLFDEWLNSRKHDEETLFLVDDSAEFSTRFMSIGENEKFHVQSFEMYKGEYVKKYRTLKKYLIVQEMRTKIPEIEDLMRINQMNDTGFIGWVYIKNE